MAEWITVKDAVGKLGIAERTVRHWIQQGKLTAKKDKGIWLIDADTIRGTIPGKTTANGKGIAEPSATSARVSVPLNHYDGLTTRLGQLETENTQYRDENIQYKKMLVSHEDEVKRRQDEVTRLKEQLEDETGRHQDAVKELKAQLEYYRQPFWRRWRKQKALPQDDVVDMEADDNGK